MTRFGADLFHVVHGDVCTSRKARGGQCSVLANYRCFYCHEPVCGRHEAQHDNCRGKVKK